MAMETMAPVRRAASERRTWRNSAAGSEVISTVSVWQDTQYLARCDGAMQHARTGGAGRNGHTSSASQCVRSQCAIGLILR